MRKVPQKTVRFAQVVQEVGNPQPYTLWESPEKDPQFSQAMRENRLMTVLQEPVGHKKDYGLVGYHKTANASYLIFPGSLSKFEGKKIIGVKYELLGEPKPLGPALKPKPVEKSVGPGVPAEPSSPGEPVGPIVQSSRQAKATKPPPFPKKFMVTLVVSAETEVQQEVEAETQREAKKLAAQKVRDTQPDFSKAKIRIRVRSAKPVKS